MDSPSMRTRDEDVVTPLEPLTAELVAALRYFRGVCHRKQVIEYIEAAHRRSGEMTGDALTQATMNAFDRHLGSGEDDSRPFRLPFGPGSHRWALSDRAMRG